MKLATQSFRTLLLCLAAAVLLPQHTMAGPVLRRALQAQDQARLIVLESTLDFGFWPDTTLREATLEEIGSLLGRTSEWYSQHLKTTFPTLLLFEAVYVSQVFDADAEFPLSLNFNANAYFVEEGETSPSFEELFQAIDTLDFQGYISEVAWTDTSTGGIFELVNKVAYDARSGDVDTVAFGNDPDDEVDETIDNDETDTTTGNDEPATCATALREYRESNGEKYTTVSVDCLESPLCNAADTPQVAERNGQAEAGIVCDFTERTSSSQWSDCQTTNSESSEELGTLLTFSSVNADQWTSTSAPPLVLIGSLTNYTGVTWGITKGCGEDIHVYLLHRTADYDAEEGVYTVIGYQALDAFVTGDVLEGKATIDGQAISGISPDIPCPYGSQEFVDLLGSCQLSAGETMSGEPNGDSSNNPGNADSPLAASSGGNASLMLLTSAFTWLVVSSALMMAMRA